VNKLYGIGIMKHVSLLHVTCAKEWIWTGIVVKSWLVTDDEATFDVGGSVTPHDMGHYQVT
jgi:hypothetical protein